MKKLLAILALLLALCMMFGVAMAEDPSGSDPADQPAEGTEEEAKEYTRFECVHNIPGVLRCFYGVDEEGNELYDDRPMTVAELKDPQYHQYTLSDEFEDWYIYDEDLDQGVPYDVIFNGEHEIDQRIANPDGSELVTIKVTAPMVLSRTCTRCGHEDVVELEDVFMHHWTTVSDTAATCVSPRHIVETCDICGLEEEYDYGDPDAMNHSWIQAKDKDGKDIITKGGCEKDGEKTLECEYCGAKKVVVIPARGHLWGDPTYEWDTEKSTLNAVHVCENVADDDYEAGEDIVNKVPVQHKEVIASVEAEGKLVNEKDCTEGRDWKKIGKFEDKDLEKNAPQTWHEEIPEHKYTDPVFTWTKDEETGKYTVKASYKCTLCGKEGSEEVEPAVTLKANTLCTAADKATYTANFTDEYVVAWGKIKKNEAAYKAGTVRVEAIAHSFEQVGEIVWEKDKKDASVYNVTLEYKCTEETCPLNKQDAKTKKYQVKTIVAARTEDETVPCDNEKRVTWTADFSDIIADLVETKTGSLEHVWDEPVVEKAGANCEDKNVMVKWCKHCRLTSVTFEEPVAPVFGETPDKTIEKKLYNTKANGASDGTYCYELETTEIYYCQNCEGFHWVYYNNGLERYKNGTYSDHIKTIVTSKLVKEHDFEPKEGETGTCTEGITMVCKGCGYETVVDPVGHTWGEWKLVHATGENGNELAYWTRKCEVCGAVDPLIIEKNELTCEDLGEEHTYAWTVVDGAHVYQCSKCGVPEDKEIPEDVHTWGKEPEITAATCLVDGKKVWTCEDCGATKEEAIKAAGKHTPGEVQIVKAANCEEDGLQAITCKVCSEVLETKTIPATGHTAGDPVITAATCTEAGKEVINCSVCGKEISSKEIPATGHTIVEEPAVAATCTAPGKTAGSTCSVCKEVLTKVEEVPALGHDWSDWEITKEATPEADGEKKRTCSRCGETETEVIPFVASEIPAYTLVDMAYGANKITGTAVHDATTEESPRLYARVTVFFVGGTYAVFADYIEDGVIDIEVHGTVLAVSVELTATKNVVADQEMVIFDSWGEYYHD